jgi:hypothetical protein
MQIIYESGEVRIMRERFDPKIVIDGQGTEKCVKKPSYASFPDKKRVNIDVEKIDRVVKEVSEINKSAEVGQRDAVWIPAMDYPDRPMLFLFLTDIHYTSTVADVDILNHYIKVVSETPNMFVVTGGDDCDNANTQLGKVASLMYEDPIRLDLQAKSWAKKIQDLDRRGKIGFMVFGNHTDWTFNGGIDWYDTFLGGMNCPILTSGGTVRVQFEKGAKYEIAATHKYWGTSKLNPTNACKRFMEHDHPDADIILLGHTHQSENLSFERGGKERIAIIGGTLKLYETFAAKHGISGRQSTPGNCVALWPDHQEMQSYKHIDRAVEEHLRRL